MQRGININKLIVNSRIQEINRHANFFHARDRYHVHLFLMNRKGEHH